MIDEEEGTEDGCQAAAQGTQPTHPQGPPPQVATGEAAVREWPVLPLDASRFSLSLKRHDAVGGAHRSFRLRFVDCFRAETHPATASAPAATQNAASEFPEDSWPGLGGRSVPSLGHTNSSFVTASGDHGSTVLSRRGASPSSPPLMGKPPTLPLRASP